MDNNPSDNQTISEEEMGLDDQSDAQTAHINEIKDEDVSNGEQEQDIPIDNFESKFSKILEEIVKSKQAQASTLAEFSNYKVRVEREKEELKKTANSKIIAQIIGLLDVINKAIESESKKIEIKDNQASSVESLITIKKAVERILADQKVKLVIPLENEKFNPEIHFAQGTIKDDKREDSVILTVIKPGFFLNEILVEPAIVIVSVKE